MAGHFDGEFHALAGPGGGHVARKLIGREHLVQQIFELDFAPGSTCCDVRKDALEIAYTRRQILHLAEAFVNLLQPFADDAEGLAEAGFEGLLELFVYRQADLFELPGDGGSERFGALVGLAGEALETAGEFFAEGAGFVGIVLTHASDFFAEAGFGGV